MTCNLGRIGVWASQLMHHEARAEAAAELETLGYSALWFPGGIGGPILQNIDTLLDATKAVAIGTGILNIWRHEPAEIATWWKGLSPKRRARVMLGVGISHPGLIGEAYAKPLATMRAWLDGLDAAGGVDKDHLCIAALAPLMLKLSAERTAGSHPYMVPVAHTRYAREQLGPGPILAQEVTVVLESDLAKARDIARGVVRTYQKHVNYTNAWRRVGWSDADIETLSDGLVDAIVACGDPAAIKARIDEHFAAGASHVCIQVATGPRGGPVPMDVLRELAPALI